MNSFSHTLRLAVLSLSYMALLSCSSAPTEERWNTSSQDSAIDAAKSITFKQGVTVTDTAQKAQPVRMPKTAPWLLDSVSATYQGELDAKTAILSLLHNQPVRFELSGNGPNVKANPSATTFQEHLDSIAAQANWAYTVTKGVVIFSDWQIVNYPLDFILGNKSIKLSNSSIVSDSSSNSGSDDSSNTLSVTNNNLQELEGIMQKILTNPNNPENPARGNPSYSVIKATNSIMVSAPPNIQKQVRDALNSINNIAGRSIYLDFDIYSVDLYEQYQRAVDIDVLKQSGVSVSSKVNTSVLSGVGNAPFVFTLDFTENGYDSQVLLKALAEHGEASLVSQGTLLLKNNEVGNIRTSSLNRWVDIISVSDNESVAPAYKESMFQVLPSITGEQINLHMVLSDTDNEPYLKSLKREAVFNQMNNNSNLPLYKITVETGTIKLGEQFVIPTEVENGETLLIAGLTRKIYNDTTARNQMLPIIGDSKNRQQRRRETIVVMTAYLLD
jgi:hypothetical protein